MNSELEFEINGESIRLCEIYTRASIDEVLHEKSDRLKTEWVWAHMDGRNCLKEGGHSNNHIDCLQDAISHVREYLNKKADLDEQYLEEKRYGTYNQQINALWKASR